MNSVSAENVDHERLPAVISCDFLSSALPPLSSLTSTRLLPVAAAAGHPSLFDPAHNYSFHLYFLHRTPKKTEPPAPAPASTLFATPAIIFLLSLLSSQAEKYQQSRCQLPQALPRLSPPSRKAVLIVISSIAVAITSCFRVQN